MRRPSPPGDRIFAAAATTAGGAPTANRTPSPLATALASAACAASLATLAWRLLKLAAEKSDFAVPMFGTAAALYSDTLGPWFWSGLCFFFGMPIPDILDRPSMGLFWGSVVATTGTIEAIPWLFAIWFLAGMTVLAWSARGTPFILSLAGWLSTTVFGFSQM